jgi:IS605 OrfB family transposase
MDKLSRPKITTRLTDEWVLLADKILKRHGPLFEQHKGFADVDGVTIHTKPHGKIRPTPGRLAVPAKFWHQVCDSAPAFLQSNRELMQQWRQERKKWVQEKTEWEGTNLQFMKFWNGPYREFEQMCEQKRIASQVAAGQNVIAKKRDSRDRGKRIERWHFWYEWVLSHPEIIEWRDKARASDFQRLPEEVRKKLKRKYPQQHKLIPQCLDWLKESNPEFRALDAARRYYVRNYTRFKRPPTLTLPSPQKHPYWFTFERDVFYKDADFEKGTIRLCLIDQKEDGAWFFEWFDAQVKCDPRLKPSFRGAHFAKDDRYPPYMDGKPGNKLNRPAGTAKTRQAGYTGAKLVLQKTKKELLFTVIEQDAPRQIKWQKAAKRRCPADNAFSREGSRIPLKVMAIDLGIRNIAGYLIAEGNPDDDVWRITWQAKGVIQSSSIPGLHEVRSHDRQLRQYRSKHGRAVKGERTFAELQDHRTGMAEDRFKKAANSIVETARKHGVHIILFEQLESLFPRAFDERWMNRQLRDMNRRKIVETVQAQSQEFGIQCKDNISPWQTSRICSRCYRPGWRFSIKGKEPYLEKVSRQHCRQYGYPIWDPGGHLFRCPHCGYRINADLNAAGNVAAKFFGAWPVVRCEKGVYSWEADGELRNFNARAAFDEWAAGVKSRREAPF